MSEIFEGNYLVPDYYPSFVCKCGECRHVCCHGWDVALPMNEYFRLLGLQCTPEIRRKLDCAMRVVDKPRPEKYAVFAKGWDGGCPLHDEDGLCMLQKNMGEEVLPWICRLYPRRHSEAPVSECSCSGGCEKTLEMLFESDEPLSFVHASLTFGESSGKDVGETANKYYCDARRICFDILSDRRIGLTERLARLYSFTIDMASDIDSAVKNCAGAFADAEIRTDTARALDIVETVVTYFIELSPNLEDIGNEAISLIGLDGSGITAEHVSRWEEAKKRFEARYPKHEIWFEKMMANHIFHEGYPFSDQFDNIRHGAVALCAAYGLLYFIAVCCTDSEDADDPRLVDVLAAVFRMIESSAFGVRVMMLLNRYKMDDADSLMSLISLK